MNRSLTRRLGTAAVSVLAGLALVVTAGPAQASSTFFSKSSGRMATVDWLEVGTLPNIDGNIHFGFMYIEDLGQGRSNIFGIVEDLQCPAGFIPDGPFGGGHGEEPEESPCDPVGTRFIDGGDTTFVMDRKFATARLTGTLAVSDHGTPLGNPVVDMTLTGFGATSSGSDRGSFSDENGSFSYRYAYTQRQATVSGRIGPMVFDNVPFEYSSATMGTFKSASRERIR